MAKKKQSKASWRKRGAEFEEAAAAARQRRDQEQRTGGSLEMASDSVLFSLDTSVAKRGGQALPVRKKKHTGMLATERKLAPNPHIPVVGNERKATLRSTEVLRKQRMNKLVERASRRRAHSAPKQLPPTPDALMDLWGDRTTVQSSASKMKAAFEARRVPEGGHVRAVIVAHEGASFNPDRTAHRMLVSEAAAHEIERQRRARAHRSELFDGFRKGMAAYDDVVYGEEVEDKKDETDKEGKLETSLGAGVLGGSNGDDDCADGLVVIGKGLRRGDDAVKKASGKDGKAGGGRGDKGEMEVEGEGEGAEEGEEGGKEEEEEGEGEDGGEGRPRMRERDKLTVAQRNKIKRAKEKQAMERSAKAERKRLKQLDRVGSLVSEISKESRLLKKKQEEAEERERIRKKKLGKFKYEPPRPDVLLTEELPSSLRALPAEGSLLQDRFDSLRARNLIEVRDKAKKLKVRKTRKEVLRESHKDLKYISPYLKEKPHWM